MELSKMGYDVQRSECTVLDNCLYTGISQLSSKFKDLFQVEEKWKEKHWNKHQKYDFLCVYLHFIRY